MITKRPWFGPKRYFGWGWTPVSWQGWLLTAIFLIGIVGGQLYFGPGGFGLLSAIAGSLIFLVVVILTGTKPGGPNSN